MTDPSTLLLTYKGLAIALVFALLFAGERLRPAAPVPEEARGWRRLARNCALFAINALLSPLIVVPLTAWATTTLPGWRPEAWSGAGALLIDLLILDLWVYFWHRANHRLPFLWRFHEVHHLDRFLDTTSAVRFHGGEVVLSAIIRAMVVIALDIPLTHVLVFEAMLMMAALFHHSNLRLAPRLERGLSWAIVTPSIHWVHHHAVRADTDSNYATILSVWDRIFTTSSPTQRTPNMEIGTEGRAERPLPGLLLRPLDPP